MVTNPHLYRLFQAIGSLSHAAEAGVLHHPDDAADIAGRHLDLQTTLRGWLDVASSTVPVALLEATVNKFLDYSTQISSPVAPGETGLKTRRVFGGASSISAACSGLAQ
ncbi:hypothetical protein AB4Z13_25760 [Rhizobium sp. YAF28]|jgi:hypothetical protein|uniref:hypothetical protein n=1 Tax=Rhizobium sp. YAF28 TaxID=3233081 RepID=UPI0013AFFF47